MSTEDVVLADCSDDEEYNRLGISHKSAWAPKIEEVEELYQRVKNNKFIDFGWKCPGRRDPNLPENPSSELEEPVSSAQQAETDDFDFEEETSPSSLKLPSKSGTSKNPTKKRTTLAGILSNMERHRIIERLDKSSIGENTSSKK